MARDGPQGQTNRVATSRRGFLAAVGLAATAGVVSGATSAGSKAWRVSTRGAVHASPTVTDGTVYVCDASGGLYALRRDDGSRRWSYATERVTASPTTNGSTVFALDNQSLHAVDGGERRWRTELGQSLVSSPTVADGAVYSASRDGLVSLNLDGTRRWQTDIEGWLISSLTVADGTVYVGSYRRSVHAIDANTGQMQWTFDTDGLVTSSPTVADDTVYVGDERSHLYALYADDGSRRWTLDASAAVSSSPTYADDTVYVGSQDGTVYAVDDDSGDVRWTVDEPAAVFSSPTVASDAVYVANVDGRLSEVGAWTGDTRWRVDLNSPVGSSPTVLDGTVYIGTDDAVHAVTTDHFSSGRGSRATHRTLGHPV